MHKIVTVICLKLEIIAMQPGQNKIFKDMTWTSEIINNSDKL